MSSSQNLTRLAASIAKDAAAVAQVAVNLAASERDAKGSQQPHQSADSSITEDDLDAETDTPHVGVGSDSVSEIANPISQDNSPQTVREDAGESGRQPASQGEHVTESIRRIASENPIASAVIGTGVAIVVAPVIVTAPVMVVAGALGFTANGIAAASVAAGIQSFIGNVGAGSLFALFQSAAAGGSGLATLAGAAQVVGGVAAASAGAVKAAESLKKDEDSGN